MITRKFKFIIKFILGRLSKIFSFRILRAVAYANPVIVNYHSINGWDPYLSNNRNQYRSLQSFENDIIFFKKYYSLISLQQLVNWKVNGDPLPNNSLFITIDDGLKVVYDLMYPILQKHEVKAAIFLNPSFVDNKDLHYLRKKRILLDEISSKHIADDQEAIKICSKYGLKGKSLGLIVNSTKYKHRLLLDELAVWLNIDYLRILKEKPLYLSSANIKEMISEGFYFGGHSIDHPPFIELSVDEQNYQIRESVDSIDSSYNLTYKIFAYPSNDRKLTLSMFDVAESVYDLSFGVQGFQKDKVKNHLHRIQIEGSDMLPKHAMKYEYLQYMINILTGNKFVKRHK